MKRNRPTEITDAPEHRAIPIDQVELRADGDTLTLTGYASTFNPYEMYGGPAAGGWIEQVDQPAFDKTLREKPDLMLLINHEGMPLARTKSGTLQVARDARGLKVTAQLDRSDPDVQRLETKMRRGDMDEMSFAFRVKGQKWSSTPEFEDDPQALRTITEISLHKGDVSVVNFGANPTTSAELKSARAAIEFLADCDSHDLVEARSEVDADVLRRAKDALSPLDVHKRFIVGAEAAIGVLTLSSPDAPAGDAAEPTKRTLSVREALARQGLASQDGGVLTLADALAQIGENPAA